MNDALVSARNVEVNNVMRLFLYIHITPDYYYIVHALSNDQKLKYE